MFCVALGAAVFIVRFADHTPPFSDPVEHFLDGLFLLHDPSRSYLLEWRASYPFLTSVVAIPFNLLGSYSYAFTTACLGALFLTGTVAVTFALGRDLFGREAALTSAMFVALYPAIFGLSVTYMLDLPLTFMVALTCLFLVKSRWFGDRRYSLLAGAAIGLGAFTRYTFLLWIALPALASVGGAARDAFRMVRLNRKGMRAPARIPAPRNVLEALLIASAIAVPWYLPRLGFLLGDYVTTQRQNNLSYGTNGTLLSLHSLLYYPRGLWHLASLPLALAFAVFGVAWLASRQTPKLLLGAWLVGGYLATTLLVRSDLRFFVPVLPAVALVTAGGVAELGRRGKRIRPGLRLLVAGLATYLAVQLYACLFGISWLPVGPGVDEFVRSREPVAWFSQNQAFLPRIHRHAWDPSKAVSLMRSHARARNVSVKIVGDSAFSFASALPIIRDTLVDAPPRFVLFRTGDDLRFPTDFVLVEVAAGGGSKRRADTAVASSLSVHDVTYRVIYTERLGFPFEGNELFLFERLR